MTKMKEPKYITGTKACGRRIMARGLYHILFHEEDAPKAPKPKAVKVEPYVDKAPKWDNQYVREAEKADREAKGLRGEERLAFLRAELGHWDCGRVAFALGGFFHCPETKQVLLEAAAADEPEVDF